MRNLPLQRAIGLAIAVLAWTACGSGAGAPAAALQVPAVGFGDDATIYNVSGQYAGSVRDSVYGTGRIAGDLAQFRGVVGGALTATYPSETRTIDGAFTLAGTSLRGTGAVTADNVSCVFTERASYDPSTHRLTGSYDSFHGCGGVRETGTFNLKQRCYYARDWAIRPDAGGLKMC